MPVRKPLDDGVIPLDWRTHRWLERLQRATGTPMAQIVASMLYDIRVDDERMHAAMIRQSLVDETCH